MITEPDRARDADFVLITDLKYLMSVKIIVTISERSV